MSSNFSSEHRASIEQLVAQSFTMSKTQDSNASGPTQSPRYCMVISHIRTCSNTCYVHCSTMYNGHHKKVIFQILQASLHIILRHEERNFYGKKSFRPPFIVTRSVLIKVFCKKCQITQLFLKNLPKFLKNWGVLKPS